MVTKSEAFLRLDDQILPLLKEALSNGKLAVVVGFTGTGKSQLAKNALPRARIISLVKELTPTGGLMDSDFIGDELHDKRYLDEMIRYRNQALALDHRVIFTAQVMHDVRPFLAGLPDSRFQIFDLNPLWGLRSSV